MSPRYRRLAAVNERTCATCGRLYIGYLLLCDVCRDRRRVVVALLSNGRRAA